MKYVPSGVARQRVFAALGELLQDRLWDRRHDARTSYFGPVTIRLPEEPEVHFSAFTRDLSASGIGMIHLMPLDNREVVIAVPLPSGMSAALLTQIFWCHDYHDGWYASGGRFLDIL